MTIGQIGDSDRAQGTCRLTALPADLRADPDQRIFKDSTAEGTRMHDGNYVQQYEKMSEKCFSVNLDDVAILWVRRGHRPHHM